VNVESNEDTGDGSRDWALRLGQARSTRAAASLARRSFYACTHGNPPLPPLCQEGFREQVQMNDTFNDKQQQIAERKTGDQQRPGERGKNAA